MQADAGCVNDSFYILLSGWGQQTVTRCMLWRHLLLNPSGGGPSVADEPAPACIQECGIEKAPRHKPSQPFQPVIRSSSSSPILSPISTSPSLFSFLFSAYLSLFAALSLAVSKWYAHKQNTNSHTRNNPSVAHTQSEETWQRHFKVTKLGHTFYLKWMSFSDLKCLCVVAFYFQLQKRWFRYFSIQKKSHCQDD